MATRKRDNKDVTEELIKTTLAPLPEIVKRIVESDDTSINKIDKLLQIMDVTVRLRASLLIPTDAASYAGGKPGTSRIVA